MSPSPRLLVTNGVMHLLLDRAVIGTPSDLWLASDGNRAEQIVMLVHQDSPIVVRECGGAFGVEGPPDARRSHPRSYEGLIGEGELRMVGGVGFCAVRPGDDRWPSYDERITIEVVRGRCDRVFTGAEARDLVRFWLAKAPPSVWLEAASDETLPPAVLENLSADWFPWRPMVEALAQNPAVPFGRLQLLSHWVPDAVAKNPALVALYQAKQSLFARFSRPVIEHLAEVARP